MQNSSSPPFWSVSPYIKWRVAVKITLKCIFIFFGRRVGFAVVCWITSLCLKLLMWSFQKSDWCQDLLFLRLLIFIDLTLLEHYFTLHQPHNEIKEDSSGWWGHRVGQTPSRPHNEEWHHDKVFLGGFVIRVLWPPEWLRISSHSFAPDDQMNLSFSSPALPFETTV